MTTQAEALRAAPALFGAAPFLVGVTGGKGGIGKSTVAANLAVSLARGAGRGVAPRVLLVDCDFGLASLDALLALPRGRHLGDVLDGRARAADAIVAGPGGIEVLASPRGVERFAQLGIDARATPLPRLRELGAQRDVTIPDLPAGIHADGLALSHAVDLSLVIATPDPASLADAYAVVKLARDRSPRTPLGLLVNEAAGPVEARQLSERFLAVVKRFLGHSLEPFGWIPRDPAVSRATAARRPVVLAEPTSPAAASFRLLAARVAGRRTETRRARSSGAIG
jgi:flagellar biosynthesis protein FlhG